MRSIYWILACCLMFAAVMVMGVSMQSCRSKRVMESVQVDSATMTAYKEELDSFAFRRLLERYNKNWTLEIRHYRPVKDTAHRVTDTYLEEQILFSHRHEKERDSAGWTSVDFVKQDSTAVRLSEESESEEEPAPKDYRILFYSVLVILVFLWMKK